MNWTPDRWNAAQTILDAALDLPQAERTAYVTEHAPDVDTREALLGLLAREPELPTMLSGSAVDLRTLLEGAGLAPPVQQGMPERVGVYRPVRLIGRGGMGVVYLAERADGQFEQTVALKLSAAGLAADVQRRFEDERRILARLSHPHIARLLGGGLFEGRPYFAMEYVEGEPITTYAERLGLSIGARVRLFRDVCAAVGYAHRNLIVHRDLKPSNVLVTQAGEVKLLDFGIARLLEDDADRTQTGERWMTPGYAAPEQIRGESITTATDVYGLGALLYALLTGSAPRGADAAALLDDFVPPRPSTALASGNGGEAARERSRRVRGDLDHIVLKALRADPSRRYASAEALSDDLDRHLRQVPVAARPERPAYVAQRFVRRNRGVVTAVTVALLLLVGLTAFYVVGLNEARLEAQREADRATRMASLTTNLFRDSRPSNTLGKEISARDLLDAASLRASTDLRADPSMRAALQLTLAETYETLGAFTSADSLADLAARAFAETGEPCMEARARQLQTHTALRRQEQALAERRVAAIDASGCPNEEARLFNTRSWLAYDRGDIQEADSLAARGLAVLDANAALVSASEFKQLRSLLLNRAYAAAEGVRDLERADSLLSLAALEIDSPIDRAFNGYNRALLLLHMGRGTQALPLIEPAADSLIRFFGSDHPNSRDARALLGSAYGAVGQGERSLVMLESVLASELETDVPRDRTIASLRNQIANQLRTLGRPKEAADQYRAVLRYREQTLGADHPHTGIVVYNLAGLAHESGDLVAAERYARRVWAIDRASYGVNSRDDALDQTQLGHIVRDAGRLIQADTLYARSLRIYQVHFPDATSRMGDLLANYARLRLAQGRPREALDMAREAREMLESVSPDGWRTAHARFVAELAAVRTGDEQSRSALQAARDALIASRGDEGYHARMVRAELARL